MNRYDHGGSGREITDERPSRARADRHDPLLGALAHYMERSIWSHITDPQRGELGQPESGVEQHERKRPLPRVGEGEEAPQLRIGEGGKSAGVAPSVGEAIGSQPQRRPPR
jgi:hypothetical protein